MDTKDTKAGIFFERRKNNISIDIIDRRKIEQRSQNTDVSKERRRLAFQVRRQDRFPFEIPIAIQVNGKISVGYSHNISPEGLSVISDVVLAPDTPMTLEFSFGNVCNLRISGAVVSCRENIIRIKFFEIRDWEKNILNFSVQELKQHPGTKEQSKLNITILQKNLNDFIGLERRPNQFRHSSLHLSKIVGWGSYLPPKEITSNVISEMVKAKDYKNVGDVVEALTGIKSRRYASSELCPSDLAAMAAKEAISNSGIDANDIDIIIFCGISKDFDEPATANVVQEKIAAKNAYAFDMTNACNGFVTGIDALDSMISSGRCDSGLVVTGELVSPYIDWNPKTKKDFKLNIFSYTIGDAGAAVVMTRVKSGETRGIKARWFSSEGDLWRLALAGTLEGANSNNKYFRSEGLELERASIKFMPSGFQEILEKLGWTLPEVDLVIPHQIPVSILDNLYHKTLEIPYEKLMWTFPKYGNLASASMPVALCEALKTNRSKAGDRIIMVGGAAGFSIGMIGLIL